jgi:hypothetical protein
MFCDLTPLRAGHNLKRVDEITLQLQRDDESGWLVAAYFDDGTAPRRIRSHFVSDPVLVQG